MATLNSYNLAEDVQIAINHGTTYLSDYQQYEVPEFWEPAAHFGDCEDYALAKRARLLASGWPADKMGLCICRTETGEGHCVLYVDTDKGAFILDNRRDWPVKPSDLPYIWESMLCDGQWRQLRGWSS